LEKKIKERKNFLINGKFAKKNRKITTD
jgi:hypothetical protein